jgi:aldehyde dehydrogenase (NAD+)
MALLNPCNLSYPDKLFIGGKWLNPVSADVLDIVSPHLEEVTAQTASAGNEDMDLAVAAAKNAFDEGLWSKMPVAERMVVLQKWQEELAKRGEDLSNALLLQTGTLQMGCQMMTGLGSFMLDFFANGAGGFKFEESAPAADGGAAVVVHEPVGVVVAIAPWNAPYSIMMNKVAPALLAGCTVIMKPAPETPLEAYIMAECAEAAGFPPGVLNLVPAERDASDHLISSAAVDKVGFTGSTVAGRRIAAVCGERIGRCSLELGGKSAAIVLDDFDIEEAAKTLANIIVIGSGQVCVTLSRVLVSREHHDALVLALKKELEAVKVGDPMDPGSQMGPLAMARQLERVENYIEKGKAEGAELICGGDRPALEKGYYINPTLFANVDNSMAIAQEEIFGPVLCVIPYKDEADAIRLANESDFGLFGAVLTNDNKKAYKIARAIRTGAYAQNAFRLDYFLPFGGFKQSGIGREGGQSGLKSYTETKTILLNEVPEEIKG